MPQNPAVVLAYAAGCGLSTKEAERLWKHARRDEARTRGVVSGHRSGVHISVVKDFADLHAALVDLHRDDGRPPLRSLDARVGGLGRLPHSTVGRVLKGRSTPSRQFVAAFAEACNVRRSELFEWMKAWDRADADRRSSRLRSRTSDPLQRLVFHNHVTPRDLQQLMSAMESTSRKAPALRLTVHVPDPVSPEADAAARMKRELVIDQAQRRGELACPQCQRPSFGYSTDTGWSAHLCSNCAATTARATDDPTLELRRPPPGPAADTPTLSLRMPAPRPPLPRRRPARSWPPTMTPQPAPSLNAETITTLDEPDSTRDFFAPRRPPLASTPSPAPAMCPPDSPCPQHGTTPEAGQDAGSGWPLPKQPGPRIRINIPDVRPYPPVLVHHRLSPPPTSATADNPPLATPADEDTRRDTP
ncbi:hypothetical protein [Streptomyces sp. NPDC016675]|uniref:hypothetical protein n=1 Tax=Streptomyces sp. NPDC016675 TaxID=3364970 RepID=UPI0036FBF17C